MINAGALVVTDLLFDAGVDPAELVLDFARFLVGTSAPFIDEAVARSEFETAFTNMALANLLRRARDGRACNGGDGVRRYLI